MRTVLYIILSIGFMPLIFGQVAYEDVTTEAGILNISGSEGIAVGDFNNDGYADFYVGFPFKKNHLYQNLGNGTFEEISDVAGVALAEDSDTRCAAWGDLNNDGWQDLYVGNKHNPDQLFLNKTNGTFEEVSFEMGIYQVGNPKSINMADVNNDGFLDIYVSNFFAENVLYLNSGDAENMTFTNYVFASGALDEGRAMGTIFFDYDKDGDIDLYLTHDGNEPNFLYENNGYGEFEEVGVAAGVNTESFAMGVDIGDINNDGWMDIHIANLYNNILLLNNGDGTFDDISASAGIEDNGMGWGTSFLDFDNDGWQDIYVGNDFSFNATAAYENLLYRNMGNLTFSTVETNNVVSNVDNTYGVVCLDYNLDGQTDILVANKGTDESVQLFKNPDRNNNWVGLKLVGTVSNRDAVGAKIRLTDNLGKTYYRELTAGCSWSSQNTLIQNIGINDATEIESIVVNWPAGTEETFDISEVNKFYTLTEGGTFEEGLNYGGTTGIFELEKNNFQFEISPNPNDGIFQIEFLTDDVSPISIELINGLGQVIFNQKIEHPIVGENIVPINLDNKNLKGAAFVRVLQKKNVGVELIRF